MHADDLTGGSNISFPTYRGGLLYRDACLDVGWEDAVPVFFRLVIENLPRRHGDQARADAFSNQRLVRFHRKADFASRRNDDYLRIAARRVSKHVHTLRDAGGRSVSAAIEGRQRLAR